MIGTKARAVCARFSVTAIGILRADYRRRNRNKNKNRNPKQEFARGGKLQTLPRYYINAHIAQISKESFEIFHVIEERLCSWLLMLHDRAQSNQWQMTHEQISLFLGVNRPTLTHAAKNLREKGFY